MNHSKANTQRYVDRQRGRGIHGAHGPKPIATLWPQATVLELATAGRPNPRGGTREELRSTTRFSAAMRLFESQGWSSSQVWASATGSDEHPPDVLTASMVFAVIDVSELLAKGALAVKGVHRPILLTAPAWMNGQRTQLGAQYDDAMGGLNIEKWQYRLDSQ